MQALDGPRPENPTECDGLKAAARDWAAAVEEIRRQTGRQQFYMLNSLLLRMPAPNSKSQLDQCPCFPERFLIIPN